MKHIQGAERNEPTIFGKRNEYVPHYMEEACNPKSYQSHNGKVGNVPVPLTSNTFVNLVKIKSVE